MKKYIISLILYDRFSRTIAITDVGQDYNLNNSYYLLFGRRSEGTCYIVLFYTLITLQIKVQLHI